MIYEKGLRIGVDGNEANVINRVGVGTYAYELLKQFSNFQAPISNFQFLIYLKDKPLADLPRETETWKYKVVGPRKLWTQIGLPLALFKDCRQKNHRVDVFFTPTHYAPRFCPCPRVIAIMDLSFLHFPEMFKGDDLYQLKNWTAYSVRKAVNVLTISQASKNDIIKDYRVEKEKVIVTYPGIDKSNMTNKTYKKDLIKEKYGVSGNYILSVGTLQPRKNFIRLIEAFSEILKPLNQVQGQDDNLKLIIVGKKGWLYKEILQAPQKFRVENQVKFLDFVDDEDLPSLYKNAQCFVLVSLYEGFGLPVLEAMSYGVPVVVSNVSSLPEVVGEAGEMVDPNNVDEIAGGLLKILKMDENQRQEMVQKGFSQAKKFSWEKCARETLEVLKAVGDKHV